MRKIFKLILEVLGVWVVVFAGLGVVPGAKGQVQFEDHHLFAADGVVGDQYGVSVSISGDLAIVGANGDSAGIGLNTGSAYVYRFDGVNWNEEQHLFAPDGSAGDQFGVSVSISNTAAGEVAIVGAWRDHTTGGPFAGSAYVYRYNGTNWVVDGHLFASDGDVDDVMGSSVFIDGDVAVVGAWADDIGGNFDVGSAYVYRYDGANWFEEGHLFASDGSAFDRFGVSVAVSGEVVIVGSLRDDTAAGFDAGSAYVYRFDGVSGNWLEEAHLFASDGTALDNFGRAVSVSGDLILVGAFGDDTAGGPEAGSAYVFHFDGVNWLEEAHLFASDGLTSDLYGISVGINSGPGGDLACVGSSRDDTAGGTDAGSAYVYRFDPVSVTWIEEVHLLASDGAGGDQFGESVAIDETTVISGALFDDTAGGVDAGSVYIFNLDCNGNGIPDQTEPDCNGNGVPDVCDIAAGEPDCNGNGIPDSCEILSGAPDCDGNGILDSCDILSGAADCDGNGILDSCDLINGAPDCDGNGILDSCDIANGAPDCNGNGILDGCDILSGIPDCDGNGVPDSCDIAAGAPDCNGNGIPDSCDLASGIPDCDGNGVLDVCEIAGGALDCNGNGIPDVCDIVSGVPDCDGNGVPDVCDIAGGAVDCNNNGVLDSCELLSGAPDCNVNGVLDSCELVGEVSTLLPVGVPGAVFPSGVAVGGSVAVLGLPQDGINGVDAGAAVVYRIDGLTSTWGEEVVLRPGDGVAGDGFGVSAAVGAGGNVVVVGAVFEGTLGVNAGAIYVFRYNAVSQSWEEETKLLASDGVAGDVFGISLDVSGSAILVGAEGVDGVGLSSGAAYVFRFDSASSSWVEEGKLTASDGQAADFFGHEVGISGEVAVVGAVLEDALGLSAGAAYVYRFNPVTELWSEETKLTASDGGAGDAFGISVDASGSWVMVGAEGRDDLGNASGAAYLYKYDGAVWGGEVKLVASDGGASEFFGHFVAIEGNMAVVGAPLVDDLGNNSGAGYVYRFDGATWGGETKMMTFDGQQNDWMGNTVGLDGGTIIMATGSAVMDGLQGALFANLDINENGVPDECDPPVCPGDITPAGGNGVVNIDDLVAVLNAFGPCVGCPEDITPSGSGNGVVNIDDLVAVLNAFGVCP